MVLRSDSDAGFADFYRRYTKTWLHALATAALTAFGTLTVVHRGFAVVAVAVYVLPPVVLYVTRSTDAGETGPETDTATDGPPEAGSEATRRDGTEPRWTAVDAPTTATLFDVTVTDAGAYAVGADGIVLADEGDGWRTLLADGPGAAAKTLRGADATADGGAVWATGDGGTLARFDATTGRHVDHSAPRGLTDTWEDVAVGGSSGDELVLLANGSGEVVRGRYRDGDLAWDEPVEPGSGSSLSGVALADESVGHACDTNDGVFETVDGGATFRQVGVEGVAGTLTDVATGGRGDCIAGADDGVLHRFEAGTWTPVRLGDEAVEAVALRDDRGFACGGEIVYERADAAADWERHLTSATGPLEGIASRSGRAVAVGRDGTVVERQ